MTTWKMAVIGLESRDRALIETAIDLASGLETEIWELIDDAEKAHAIIVDFDSDIDQNDIKKYMSEQSSKSIVQFSSSDNKDNTSGIRLAPPLSYKNVITLLKELEPELSKVQQSHEDKAAPIKLPMAEIEQINPVDIAKHKIDWLSDDDIDQTPVLVEVTSPFTEDSETATQNLFTNTFVPDSRLLGLIANIIESGKTTLVSHYKYPELRIFPDNGWFVFTGSLDSFPEIFREPIESFTLTQIEDEIKDELVSGRLPQSLWKLMFTAALFGSEGRLLDHLQKDDLLHLTHTPYFGMIPHTADHILVAEYMVNNSSNIENINLDTKVDIETIIDFCNACDAIQLLRNEKFGASETNELINSDLAVLEEETTIKSEITHDSEEQKKPGLINSLWSSLTKTS